MVKNNESQVVKDLANRKITVTRHLEADVETVWSMWTKPELLDTWWAPRPWRAETKTHDFKPGGKWIYFMVGPDGERHGALVEYTKIDKLKSFEGTDAFADEKGNKNTDLPQTTWKVEFRKTTEGTKITATITASAQGAIEKMLEMGFEQGFTMALDQLDEILQKKKGL
jgi:uncharacterized protein YndB with AHSA1/START domain